MAGGRDGIRAGCGIWACTAETQFHHFLEVGENIDINGGVRRQETAHLTLHLVDLARAKQTLRDNGP
jgi:hypothetical protein